MPDYFGAADVPLSPDLEDRLQSELQPGERLVWAGQPRLDLATRQAWFLVPCGIVFGGFALFWIVGAAGMGGFAAWNFAPAGLLGCFPLFGVPFFLIGLWLIASPYWLRRRAQQMLYALTDQRAIVFEPGWRGAVTVRNYSAAGLGRMSRTERPDGSGDLVFEEFTTSGTAGDSHRTSQTTRRGFLAIDRVREVEELVRKTLLK
jgi:hypothetical protein